MVALPPLVSEFTIVGRLEDVITSKSRIKYISLSTPDADYSIDIAKSPKSNLDEYLQPGCSLKVTGMRKYKLHQEQFEYKAYSIELLAEPPSKSAVDSTTPSAIANSKPRTKILVCQGSSCYKQGGRAITSLLQTQLKNRGLSDKVEIKMTGCMKRCKQAPCLIMPGRNYCSRVQPQQVATLVDNSLNRRDRA